MDFQLILIILAIIILFLGLFDIGGFGKIFEGNTRQTPYGPVLSRCAIHGGRRFYGLGGKCDEFLTWPDIFIMAMYIILIYLLIYR
jgi:hypothetical protein